jgi:hypothetical protein
LNRLPATTPRERLGALCALAGLALFLYADVLSPRRCFWYRDITAFWAALADSFVRVVGAGALPLWNPDLAFGMPLLGDPGAQVLYPFTWLNLIVGLVAYYKLYALFHVTLGGAGFYLLARRRIGKRGALVGAAVWMCSGPFQEMLTHTHHFAGAAWMPWVLHALDRLLVEPSVRSALGLAALAATQVLAGSGDLCLLTAFIGVGYLASLLLAGEVRSPRAALGMLAGVTIPFAAALGAAQWLPTVVLLMASSRNALGLPDNTYWSLHPASLLELVVPRVLSGLPISDGVRAALYESREPLYACLYLGAPALVLIVLGFGTRRLAKFALCGFGISLLVALGHYTAFYAWLIRFTPLALLRYPTKYTLASAFFWSLLVAVATEGWLQGEAAPRARRRAGWVGGLLAAVALAGALAVGRAPGLLAPLLEPDSIQQTWAPPALAAKLSLTAAGLAVAGLLAWFAPTRWAWLLPALVVADLAYVGRGVNPAGPRELLEFRPQASRLTEAGARLYVSTHLPRSWLPSQVVRMPGGWQREWAVALGTQELMWPPTGTRWGLRGSFDGDFTGLAPPALSRLTSVLWAAEGKPLGLRLLQLAAVDYVIVADENSWPGFEEAGRFDSVLEHPIRVLRVPQSLPLAYAVGKARVAAEPEAIRVLASGAFDPTSEVVLASGEALSGEASPAFKSSVREVGRRPDAISLEVDANAAGYVVLVEGYDPGWSASVDGQPTGVVPANVLFRAVAIPAGSHLVELRYRPRAVVVGAWLSLFGLLAAAVTLWVSRSRDSIAREALA